MRAAPTPEIDTATTGALFQHFRRIVNLPTPPVLRSYIYWAGGTVHNEVTHRCGHCFLCAVLELALLVAKRCGICGIQHKICFVCSIGECGVCGAGDCLNLTRNRTKEIRGKKGPAIPLAGAIARVGDYVRYGDGTTTADQRMVQTWMLPRFGIPALTRGLAELYVCSHEASIQI